MSEDNILTPADYFVSGQIEKFEGKSAVINLSDGQKISWPIKNLPERCEVGTEVRLVLSTEKSQQSERETMAKAILNEILKRR